MAVRQYYGDGSFSIFNSAVASAGCAINIQQWIGPFNCQSGIQLLGSPFEWHE